MWRDLEQKRNSTRFLCLHTLMLTSMLTTQTLALTFLLEAPYFLTPNGYRMNIDILRMKAVLLELAQSAT